MQSAIEIDCVARISCGFPSKDICDEQLPKEYSDALSLYKPNDKQSGIEFCDAISHLISANFVPESIDYWESLLVSPDDIDAYKVVVTGFQFDGSSNLPEINALAYFKVKFKHPLINEELEAIESSHEDPLGWCVNFFWQFAGLDESDWDGWLINNSGVEMFIVEP